MENILSSLHSLAETWLTFGSTAFHVDPKFPFLSGLGLLLLYICYLILNLVSPSLWRNKYSQKPQGKIKRKRRKAFRGKRTAPRDIKEEKRLQTIPRSAQGKPCDPTGFWKLLCPDPLCSVCNRARAQASPEDGAASVSQPPSTVPVTETSFTLSSHSPANQPGHPCLEALPQQSPSSLSILSSDQITPVDGLPFPTLPDASLSPPPKLLASLPPPLPQAPREEQHQPEAPTSMVESLKELSPDVPTAKDTVCERQAESESSQLPSSAEDQSFNQEPPDTYTAQASHQKLTSTHTGELRIRLSPSPDVLALLERQDKRETDFPASKHSKEKTESFSTSLNTSGKISESTDGPKNLEDSLLSDNGKGKPEGTHIHQQPTHPKTSEDQSEVKDTQLFWGFPALHSESLKQEPAASVRAHFNRMAKASAGSDSPSLTYSTPLTLSESDQRVWLQISPQSQTKPDCQANSEVQGLPLIQALTFSPLSQLRICGVRFHKPKEEVQLLGPSEIHQLEYNLLQKTLESLLGLSTVTQRSQKHFCPPPPKMVSVKKLTKVNSPRSILPGDFILTKEVQKKLEHHLRKRLIQHLWGLPNRIHQSRSHMNPNPGTPEDPVSRSSHGLSWISFYKQNASRSIGLSQSGIFHEKLSQSCPLKEKKDIKLPYSEMVQNTQPQSDSKGATKGSVHSNPQTDPEHWPGSLSESFVRALRVKQSQKESKTSLQEHLGRKTKQIREGQIPGTVGRHWHATYLAQPPPKITSRQMKDRKPLAGKEDPPKKHQRSLSLSLSREKVLEEHIKSFGRRMTFGLPQRVEESFQSYMTRAEPPHPLPLACGPSETFSGVGSGQASKTLRRNTSGDRMGKTDLIPIQEGPRPVTPMRQPASENKQVFADKDLSIVQSGREPIPPRTPGTLDTGSLQQPGSDRGRGPGQPTRAEGPTEERLASCTNTHGLQRERGNPEGGSRAEGFTELLKGEEPVPGLYLQPPETLTATRGTCSPGSHVTACQPVPGMSVSHEPDRADYKSQVSRGVMLNPGSGTHMEAPGLPPVPFASEEVTSKPQASRSGAMATFRVLHVQLPSAGISMEPRQALWVPAHVSGKCQDEKRPPAAKDVSPLANEAGKLGGGDAGLGAPHSRGKRHSVQARAPEGTHAHASSLALSPMRRSLENQFSNQVRCFLQWLSPGRKHRGQERPLAKGSSSTLAVGGTSPIKGRCEFCGHMEAQKCVRDPGVVLRRQLEHRHGEVTPCPQAPVCPLMGSEDTQQEEQLQAQAEPVQRSHPCCQASCSQVQRAESCSPGQGQMAPGRYGITRKAKMVQASLLHASQGARVPWQSSL